MPLILSLNAGAHNRRGACFCARVAHIPNDLSSVQAVREKAAAQAMEFHKEREQLLAELSKAKGRGGLSDRAKVLLGSKENIRA